MEKENAMQSNIGMCGRRESDALQVPSCSKKSRSNLNINDLPEEILQKILSCLSIKEKFCYERVCRRWQKNVFSSVTKLAIYNQHFQFKHFSFCGVREHSITKQDVLHTALVSDSDTIKLIVSKCGKNICSISGYATDDMVPIIVENCKRLECCSLIVNTSTSLKLISNKFSQQLTCAALPRHLETEFVPFIIACPNLSSISSLNDKHSFTWDVPSQMITVSPKTPESSQNQLSKIRSLAIYLDKTSNDILGKLPALNNLATLYIRLECNLNRNVLRKAVRTSWTSLTSLSLEMQYGNCVLFRPLPPNLEYLSLVEGGVSFENEPKKIKFSTNQPKLKILKLNLICLEWMEFTELLGSISACFPSLEVFNFKCEDIEEPDDNTLCFNEGAFQPLLSMTLLKELTLTMPLAITKIMNDELSRKLFRRLKNLRVFGEDRFSASTDFNGDFYCMPKSSMFWKILRTKAISHSSDVFHICGEVRSKLYLDESLSNNIILHLCNSAKISLSESFGTSKQWLGVTERSRLLKWLVLEVRNNNINLGGLPKSLVYLHISCKNEAAYMNTDALELNSHLPNLTDLRIVQKFMSNDQLEATLANVGTACPNLRVLLLHRENKDLTSIDRHMLGLLNCKSLQRLIISDSFLVTDLFGAELVNKLEDLKFLCSNTNEIGINCGPLILKALVYKALRKKDCRFYLQQGPSEAEIASKIAPLLIPKNLFVKSKNSSDEESETSSDDELYLSFEAQMLQ